MTNSDNSQSPLDQYLVPLAVCVPVCVAAFFYLKKSMATDDLPPVETTEPAKKASKKKASKKKAEKKVAKEEVKEEPVAVVEAVEAEEEKAAPKKKTGAQKRKEKKAKEEAEKKAEKQAEKKESKKADKKAAPKQQPVKKVVEEEWNVVSDEKKVQKGSQKAAEPVEEAKPAVSEKQKKKAAKERAEQQRKNAKKNDHLANLPEEVLAQMAKFNAAPAAPAAAAFNDEWTDISVKTNTKPKKVETTEVTASDDVDKPKPMKTKVTVYASVNQSEIFKPMPDQKADEFAKYSFKGLEASW